jgi:hypothetical protein
VLHLGTAGFSATLLRELGTSYKYGILFIGQECARPTVGKFCLVTPDIVSVKSCSFTLLRAPYALS